MCYKIYHMYVCIDIDVISPCSLHIYHSIFEIGLCEDFSNNSFKIEAQSAKLFIYIKKEP